MIHKAVLAVFVTTNLVYWRRKAVCVRVHCNSFDHFYEVPTTVFKQLEKAPNKLEETLMCLLEK
jgi:hypothetical protein